MKIKSLDVFPLSVPFEDGSAGIGLMPSKWTHLDFVLVRLETDNGVVGWGDAFAYNCRTAVAAAVRDMVAPLALAHEFGELDADEIATFNLFLQRRLHLHGRYGITIFAISAVDIALWDIAAKMRSQSLAAVLGGRDREILPAYASLVRYGDPESVSRFCHRAKDEGYRDVKLHEIALPAIAAGRDALGGEIRMTTDVNCNWSRDEAEALFPEMKALDLYWVEEPLFPPDDASALAELESKFGVAIASGENACTSVEFARTAPAITFLQPSVIKVGGISEFLKVCDLAKSHGKTVMPHAPYFGPGYWATVQLMSAGPECGLFERFYIEPEAYVGHEIPLPTDGMITVPDGVGLGFEPDYAVLETYRA